MFVITVFWTLVEGYFPYVVRELSLQGLYLLSGPVLFCLPELM